MDGSPTLETIPPYAVATDSPTVMVDNGTVEMDGRSTTPTAPRIPTQTMSVLKQLWSLRAVIIVFLVPIILMPLPLVENSTEGRCAYLIIVMAIFWISEAIPIAVTSLIPIFLCPMMGILTARQVSATYLNDTSMLFIGGLIVAIAIETWDLHKRIALRVLMLVGAEPRWLMAGLMFVTWFLSMWISNTATTAMMIPIVQAILQQLKDSGNLTGLDGKNIGRKGTQQNFDNRAYEVEMEDIPLDEKAAAAAATNAGGDAAVDDTKQVDVTHKHSTDNDLTEEEQAQEDADHLRMCKALSLAVAYAANTGGIASLTGTGPNVVLKGQSDIIFDERNIPNPITFATWLIYGLPLSFIVLIVLWIWMQIFFLRCRGFCSCFRRKTDGGTDDSEVKIVIRKAYTDLGPISFAQKVIIILFIMLVILWITRDLGGTGGWAPSSHQGLSLFRLPIAFHQCPHMSYSLLPSSVPNVFCFRKPGRFRKPDDESKSQLVPILNWRNIHEKMPWSLYLLLGGGYALAKASTESGLSRWVGERLTVFSSLNPWLMLLILCYILTFATEVTSNTAIATLMMPILAQLALSLNVNPLFFMFPAALTTSFAFMLPVATPPNAIVFSYGQVRVIDMVACGFVMNVVTVPILVFATITWGNAFFHFDTLPDGFNVSIPIATTATPLICPTLAPVINATLGSVINGTLASLNGTVG
ncbi:solute carrier family 13 member 5-like [Gigantopelta aegis]|uniref:solute carrier family 13 member 5-like n=1 Tax=Gigantopelta aegis TaxID=1735272 RepID=UPI001B88E242|nr:solute carrier family 13 member 5-like [Gigantopelta aegis]